MKFKINLFILCFVLFYAQFGIVTNAQSNGDLRLTEGNSGQLEVYFNGWGFICDDGWGTVEANTACKILGYGTAVTTTTARYNASRNYKLNLIDCIGNETSILDCGYRTYVAGYCSSYEHIYIECGYVNGNVRLNGGDSGLLEVYYNGWGFICDDGWGTVDANTVCQILGYGTALSTSTSRYNSSTNYKLNYINCGGSEASILDCGYSLYTPGFCSSSEHIYISCGPENGEIRLTEGFSGLLEVYYNGWGFICDDGWDNIDANTSCRILGYEGAITTSIARYNSSTNYKLNRIACTGNESSILDCGYTLYTPFYCSSSEHIFIECGPVNGELRLTGGDSGLVEVYYNGWGFICDDGWGSVDSTTACTALGYGSASSTTTSVYHSSTNYKLRSINCQGTETNILDCGYTIYVPNVCTRYEHVSISCASANGRIRLTEGFSGLLEVYYNGWGFICDDGWDNIDANTSCRILGYEGAITTSIARYNSSTNYKLNRIACTGNESSILDCGYTLYTPFYCSSSEHIFIECGPVNGDLRLAGGDSGLVEVYYNGWGYICDDSWGTVDSNTICQILGYGAAISTTTSSYHVSTNYKLNYINCGGSEARILDCGYRLYTPGFCSRSEHVYISCGPANGRIRLTEGFSGLLEVYYNGWGFICDDGWDNIDANTSCRILGYEGVITTTIARYNSSTNYKLNRIACTGNESSILDCGYTLYTPFYCSSSEHIFIECGPVNGDLRLTGGNTGLVEVYYNGWGFICDDGWGTVDSNTICQILGYGAAESTTTSSYHVSRNYKLNYISCTGNESSILDCGYREYTPNFCSQNEHVYVDCGPANGQIRLTEGFSGLLEVYYNGWGFICDDGWDNIDANTSCRILGYEGAITTSIARYNSSTNYKLNRIACTGSESSILDCGYTLYTPFYCSSSEHIFIECGPVNGDLRLAGGDSGLVEVYYNGWGYICDDSWGTVDSTTVCRILGYGSAASTTTSSYHVSTNYKLNYINCGGSEARILDCGYSLYTPGFCSRSEHVYISCGAANGEIRLTGGFSGLLEVYYNGWGFVCDSGWDIVDANTTCKILGYESVITTSAGHYNTSSNYKLTSIACTGNEAQFLDCGYSTNGFSLLFCSASDHVFIECGPVNGDLRLAGGDSGLVEVYYNGWGFICDDGWGTVDSNTICQILGYGAAVSTTTSSYHVSRNYKLNYISCTGNESSILDCGYREYVPNFCSQNEHVYITCGPANGEIRLTEGFRGLLEVYYDGWGFVCDDGWGSIDANTTCKILGYESSITTSIGRYNASRNYKINFIDCSGSETSFLDCNYQNYTPNYCSAYEHIYIECGPVNGDLRLTEGDSGLLEVYYNGWGFICDDGWGTVDANTVCILLGHDAVNSTQVRRYHSSTDYKLNYIACTGNETSILDCGYREYQPNFCSQSEHIYISCSPAHGELRLTGGFSGLLEVFYNGWGFICDDGWDSTDANTTCRILGYESAITTSIGQYNSSTNYKLNNIECQGSETSILDCTYRIYSLYTCSGSEHIYIECGPVNGDLRLAGGDSGLVEVYYNGWGFICDDGWGTVDSNTICQILGYGAAVSTTTSSYHVSRNYKLNYISCTGNESSILDCGYREYVPNFCSQNEHVYVACGPANGAIRLTGGFNGLLEIYYNGWGFICDDGWDTLDANTTCKILGYETAITTSIGRYNASTNYKINFIECLGTETNILDCNYRLYSLYYCSASEHIYLECGPINGDLRLAGGDSGLVEVYYNGWGYICDDAWGTVDSNTICQILGYGAAVSTTTRSYHVSTNYKLNLIGCTGNEASILDCGYRVYRPNYCSQYEHVNITCGPANGEIRLTEGFRGLLEVYYDGWGFVCDDGWGSIDANTTCKILGYESSITTSIGRYNASRNYKINFIDCSGSETSFLDCNYQNYTPNYCSAYEHIYIECGPVNGDLRLTEGDSGLLEVYYNGWGFICDDGWGTVDANTVCIFLGHNAVNSTQISRYHSSTDYKLNYIACTGNETSILDCGYREYRPNFCSQSEHIYISCSPAHGELRLTGGFSGLLEVFYNGWGFICDDGWDSTDANTTCRILGYESAITTSIGQYNSSTNYKLNNIECQGSETSILDCTYRIYSLYTCSGSEHIYIECGPVNGNLRLAGGDSGLVEVYYNGWGYICDDGWGTVDSNTICQILGYGAALSTTTSRYHVSRNYKLNYISCTGNESSILECGYREYVPNFCSQNEHVYVTCGPANGAIRLTGGFNGLLEIYYNGWGFICDDGWDTLDANTTCKILGYETAITTSIGRYNASTNYKINFIECLGTETNILDCNYRLYSLYYCSASEHIYLECGPINGDLRLAGGDSGLVEVYYNGWGYICDDAWGTVDSNTVCQILGYGVAVSTTTRSYHVSTNYKLNLIGCTGNEASILDCGYRVYRPNYCSQYEHVNITCSPVEHGPPVNAILTVRNSTSILVEWSPPISSYSSLFTYTVFYSGDPFDTNMKSVTTGPSTTRVLLMNLNPYTLYSVYITAVTHFYSNQTEILTARTSQQAPTAEPEDATAMALNSTSLLIRWSPPPPIHQNGPIRSYTLSYHTDGLSDAGTTSMQITVSVARDAEYPLTTRSQYILSGLNPYNVYNVTIVARNDEGTSPQTSVTERLLGTAPSQPPRNVTVETKSSTTIQVSWDPPPISTQNGIIISYRIYFQGFTFDTERGFIEFTIQTPVYPAHDRNSMLLSQLEEYNQYNIAVEAVNINGTSASSGEVTADTLPASPSSPPENIRITTASSTSVNISWYPPTAINQNGVINGYTILYQKAAGDDAVMTVEIDSQSAEYPQSELHNYILRNLEKETNYSIEIKARNTDGLGEASLPQYHYTKELVPGLVQALTVVSKTSSTITVSWKPPVLLYPDSTISAFTLKHGENINSLESVTISVDTRESYQHTFSNLNPQTRYIIRVYASNVFGNGENADLEVVTNPQDSIPQITNPDSNGTLTEDLSLSYNRTISCAASGYPLPTIRWYNSENEAITDGPILVLTVRNVTNDIVFICKAENRVGFVSRSVQIAIRVVDPDSTLDDLGDEINVAGFNPEEAGEVADTIRLALPNTDNVPPEDVNKTRETLDKGAGVNEVLLDKITDNDTAVPLDDAERILDTAGEIAVKDTELDAGVDTPVLSPEALNQGIISFASDALMITLRTIEKVCRNLGINHLKNDSTQETVTINSKYVKVYGVNLPIKDQSEELSLPINGEIAIGESVKVSKDTMVGLADGQTNVKIFVATLNLDSALLNRGGKGTKHASSIVIVVIPKILTNISLSKDATITLPTRARPSSIQSGTYLRGNVWVKSGILTNVISENITELETNHFTSFALFDTPTATTVVIDWDFYLSIISYVLSFISIIFLILSLLLFIFSSRKGFFKVEINILYFNLALALLFANGIFALYGIRASVFPDLFCKILAGIIHYSWITVFTWCLLFGIYIFYKLTCGINKERKVYPYFIIIAWTVPLIFPIITVALKLDEYIDNTEHCFPSIKQSVVIGLVGPILILSTATILLTVVFSLRFLSVKKRIESEKQRAHIKHILTSTGVLNCFLIVPWIILLVYALLGYFVVAFQWIGLIEWGFVLLNDLMGIVFFFVIAIRNRQVILLICGKHAEDETEVIQREVPRRDVIDNPTYGGMTSFGAENLAFDDSIKKNLGAENSIYAEIGDFKSEKGLMEKKRIVNYNPYATSNNMACDSFPTPFDTDLPPVYDQVARVTSATSGFNNPVYGMGGGEAPQEVYQGMNFADNPCLEEDLKPEEEPSPIHPTGTRIEKENDYEV